MRDSRRAKDQHDTVTLAQRRFWAFAIPVVCVFAVSILSFTTKYRHTTELQQMSSLRKIVQLAHNTIEPIIEKVRNGEISADQGIKQVRNIIHLMTYDDDYGPNYIFMGDYHGKMLLIPNEPFDKNTNQWGQKDGDGKYIVQSLTKTAMENPNGAFVRYRYIPPGSSKPDDKLSFVLPVPELNCYIGTGAYLSKYHKEQLTLYGLTWWWSLGFLAILSAPSAFFLRNVVAQNHRLNQEQEERQKVEAALESSEERLRLALESVRDGLWDLDLPTGKAYYSPAYYTMLGYTPGEFEPTRSNSERLIHPDDVQVTRAAVDATISGQNNIYECEFRMLDKQGEWRWILSRGSIIERDIYGVPLRMIGTHTDIHQRKQMESDLRKLTEELKQREQLLIAFMENLPAAAYYKNIDGRYTIVNQAFADMVNRPKDELIGKTVYEVLEEPRATFMHNADILAWQNPGQVYVYEGNYHVTNLSVIMSVHKLAVIGDDNQPVGLAALFFDVTKQRLAEQALKESDERLRNVIESSADTFMLMNLESRILFAIGVEHCGISPDGIIGKLTSEVFPSEANNRIVKAISYILETGKACEYEIKMTIDGTDTWFLERLFPVSDTEGHVKSISLLSHDITRMKSAEEALKVAEEYYRSIFENAAVGIFRSSMDGVLLDCNKALSTMFGYDDPAGAINKIIDTGGQLYVSKERRREIIDQISDTGEYFQVENEFVCKDGSTFFANLYIRKVLGEDGQVSHLDGFVEDITQRIQYEKDLEQSRARLTSVFENIPMVLWAMDKDGRYILQSPKSIEYWGYHIGQTVIESSLPGPVRDEYIESNQQAMNGEVVNRETYETIGGEARNFVEMVAPIRVGDKIDGLVGLSMDITDQKRAADMLLRLNEELERRVGQRTNELGMANQALSASLEALKEAQNHLVQSEKMAALGGLVAGIAHEINTPLGIGVTAASFLEHKTKVLSHQCEAGEINENIIESFVEIANECSSMILANLKRAGDLIESFKQIAADQTSEKRRKFNIYEYLEEVLLSIHPRLKHSDSRILLDCPKNLNLDGYPGAYSQIITNLVMNSLIHAFDGIDSGTMRISVQSDDKQVIIVYSDDGKGMDESTRSRVFEPFFTTKRGQGGSGLGLHIVYNLVSQTLGGRIECSSKLGEGTQFTIYVPIEGKYSDV